MVSEQQSGWSRFRAWFTVHHLAQVALVVQQLIVLRTAFEFFRLGGANNTDAVAYSGAFLAAIGGVAAMAIVSLVLYFNRQGLALIVLTLFGIVVLVIWKFISLPLLG